jgi:hypothetical protein
MEEKEDDKRLIWVEEQNHVIPLPNVEIRCRSAGSCDAFEGVYGFECKEFERE